MVHQIQRIFPEWEISMDCLENPEAVFIPSAKVWDALLLDLDVIEPMVENFAEFVSAAAKLARRTIVFLPQRLLSDETKLAGDRTHVVRKPVTTGEVSLLLSKALRPT